MLQFYRNNGMLISKSRDFPLMLMWNVYLNCQCSHVLWTCSSEERWGEIRQILLVPTLLVSFSTSEQQQSSDPIKIKLDKLWNSGCFTSQWGYCEKLTFYPLPFTLGAMTVRKLRMSKLTISSSLRTMAVSTIPATLGRSWSL